MGAPRLGGRPRVLDGVQVAEAVRLRSSGLTFADIGRELGIPRSTVRDALTRTGKYEVPEHLPIAPVQPSPELGAGDRHQEWHAPAPVASSVRSLQQIQSDWALDEALDPSSTWYPPSLPLRPESASAYLARVDPLR